MGFPSCFIGGLNAIWFGTAAIGIGLVTAAFAGGIIYNRTAVSVIAGIVAIPMIGLGYWSIDIALHGLR